jgi:prephenate dehydrogenase
MTGDERTGSFPEVVAVVGLGLMGGSLCRALKRSKAPPRILGIDTKAVEGAKALDAGAIDSYEPDGAEGLREADLVVFATPLGETVSLLRQHAGDLRERTLVTDVVSLKVPVLRAAAASGIESRFVGAHPICGGAESGFGAGTAELFDGATVWLCAPDGVPAEGRATVEAFWRNVGGVPRWTEAEEHDRRMAWASHLPQLVSNALAGALDAAGCTRDELGPGGRDMTRLAGSNPEIWRDLLEASAPVTGLGLTSVSNALNVLADLLARREMDRIAEFMERTRRWARAEE